MKNDGGQAFPSSNDVLPSAQHIAVVHPGMSLRDWFAGMALQTLVRDWAGGDPKFANETADMAYQFANAMIAERSKE